MNMNDKELIELVKRMRESQRTYFRDRSQLMLSISKQLEKQVDKEIDSRENKYEEQSLFNM